MDSWPFGTSPGIAVGSRTGPIGFSLTNVGEEALAVAIVVDEWR